jgi:S-methylmethionine-dependent homocysteine/selenocysteine methylase
MLSHMTPLFPASTLELLADEQPLDRPAYGDYCIASASIIVANRAWRLDWIGLDANEDPVAVVAAPRQAVMIAEQLAKRAYINPDAIVAEGGIGPIGGDRTVEDFARTFELTDEEKEYLDTFALGRPGATTGNKLWSLRTVVREPELIGGATIWLPDLDPRAKVWPVGTTGIDEWAYGEPV